MTANWRNGTIGSTIASGGGFYRGLSNSTVSKGQPATGGDAGFDPANTSIEYRIKKLPNNAQIWDIGGNVWQWVEKLMSGDGYTGYGTYGWVDTNIAGITRTKIKTPYDSTYGVGRILNNNATNDRTYLRGGAWFETVCAGAFALRLDMVHTGSNGNCDFGFRCTRP